MTWFKVDDSFYDHPKIFDAPDCAVALWTRAGAWAARNLTDGAVPSGMPARLCDDPERAVKELLDRGLWKRAKGGYRFHDWGDYQPNKSQVEDERKAARVRMQKLREERKAGGQKANGSPERSANEGRTFGDRSPSPTRPVPKGRGGTGDLLGARSETRATTEPPNPRCEQHLDVDDPPPCGPCGDARRARTRWDLSDAERRRTQPQCRLHRGEPAHNCGRCRADALALEDS